MSAAEQTGSRQQVTAERKAVLEQMQAMLEPQEVPPRSWLTHGFCGEGVIRVGCGCGLEARMVGKRRGAGEGGGKWWEEGLRRSREHCRFPVR